MKESKEASVNNRKFITAILVILTVVSFTLTVVSMIYFRSQVIMSSKMSDNEEREYDRHYVLISENQNSSFWSSAYSYMSGIGENSNVYVEKMGDNLAEDYPKQELMEIAIASKVDGIIYEADESDESRILISKATAAGIPVVTVAVDSPSSARRSFVGISYYNMGIEYGKLVQRAYLKLLKEKTDEEETDEEETEKSFSVLVLVDENSKDTSQNVIVSAMKERLEKYLDLDKELVINTIPIDNSGDFTAEESIQNVFQSPEVPDIIVCLNEVNTVGVYQTIVEQNKVGQSIIIGYYDSEAILKAISKDIIFATVTVDMKQLAKDCVNALNEYIEYGRVSDYYGVDFNIIDSKNMPEYSEGGVNHE